MESIFNGVAGRKRRCFPVKFETFSRTPILKNTCERLASLLSLPKNIISFVGLNWKMNTEIFLFNELKFFFQNTLFCCFVCVCVYTFISKLSYYFSYEFLSWACHFRNFLYFLRYHIIFSRKKILRFENCCFDITHLISILHVYA